MISTERTIILKEEIPEGYSLSIASGERVNLHILCLKSALASKIVVNVARNGSFHGVFADFSPQNVHVSLEVHLEGEGAHCHWHLASLCGGDCIKLFEPSVFHEAPRTEAVMDNYGLALERGNLSFTGVSLIQNGAKKSVTRQSAKIIVFDPHSKGRCSPVLKISENDVDASHAAVVGRLNSDHLFYLESRGLSEGEAKRLITLGYLRPIVGYFDHDDQIALEAAIEGGFHA